MSEIRRKSKHKSHKNTISRITSSSNDKSLFRNNILFDIGNTQHAFNQTQKASRRKDSTRTVSHKENSKN